MDAAYFVGRKEILGWINDTFAMNLLKIEDTASGAGAGGAGAQVPAGTLSPLWPAGAACCARPPIGRGGRLRAQRVSVCAGALACQICDAVFPSDVPMAKVRRAMRVHISRTPASHAHTHTHTHTHEPLSRASVTGVSPWRR